MRILMTIDAIGGVWSYALELSSWLLTQNVEVVFASMGRALTPKQRAQLTARGVTLEESEFALEWMENPWRDVARAGEWLVSLEQKYAPSVVHLNGFVHAAAGFRAPVMVVAHSSVLSWWRAVFGEDAPASYNGYRERVSRGLRLASRIVAPSHAMLGDLAAHEPWLRRELEASASGRMHSRALVIENGIELRHFEECEKQPFVLSASRVWDRAKNVALLARAAADISWPVLVAGERGSETDADFDARDITLLGEIDREQLAPLMRTASIYASPALYEPFGLSILEAAAGGAALVLADIPSLRELWGGAALFANPRDPAAFGQAVQSLIDSAGARRHLSLCARTRARRYTLERAGSAYLGLYERLEQRQRHAKSLQIGLSP